MLEYKVEKGDFGWKDPSSGDEINSGLRVRRSRDNVNGTGPKLGQLGTVLSYEGHGNFLIEFDEDFPAPDNRYDNPRNWITSREFFQIPFKGTKMSQVNGGAS